MSAQMDPEYARRLDLAPKAISEAILKADDGLEALIESLPESVDVLYTYRLIKAVAVRGRSADILALAALPCVQSIEAVGVVTANRKEK